MIKSLVTRNTYKVIMIDVNTSLGDFGRYQVAPTELNYILHMSYRQETPTE